MNWIPPRDNIVFWDFHPFGPMPTLFYHFWYIFHEQYPNGVGDMVGFWAESRILGGVLVFDRTRPDSDAIFTHPDKSGVTYRICELLPQQKKALLDFLLAKSPPSLCPLPILPTIENKRRVDPEEPIHVTGIYRDIWERNELPTYMGDDRGGDVVDHLNFITEQEHFAAADRAEYARRRRLGDDYDIEE